MNVTNCIVVKVVVPIALLSVLVLVQFALPGHTRERVTIGGEVLVASVLLLLLAALASPVTVTSPRTLSGKTFLLFNFF